MLSATVIRFKREEDSKWERGIGITTEPGLCQVVAIFPEDATSRVDAVEEVWKYEFEPYDGAFTLSQQEA